MFRYYRNKISRLLVTRFFQLHKVTGILDPGISNLKEIVDVFPSNSVLDTNQSAYPETIQYEFFAKQAYILENVSIWPECSIVSIPNKGLIIGDTAFNQYRLDKLMSYGTLLQYPVQSAEGLCTTIQCGPGWANYYHWLVDNLPRLFTLTQPRFQCEPAIYLYLSGDFPSFVHEVLQAVLPENVRIVKIEPNRRLISSKYIWLPYLSGDCSGYLPPEYFHWFNSRLSSYFHIDPSQQPDKLIYISRQHAQERKYLNESDLIDAFVKLGLKSYSLEECSFRDQVSLFKQAKLVVGRHGAGLTNLIFSNQTTVLEHFSNQSFNHYRLLCKAKNIQYTNLISQEGDNKNSNINAPIEEMASRVEQLLSQ